MSTVLDFIAQFRLKVLSGTSDTTVTIPTGAVVLGWSAQAGGSGATVVITPSGAGQQPADASTVPIGANGSYTSPSMFGQWAAGTTFALTGIATYAITIGYTPGM